LIEIDACDNPTNFGMHLPVRWLPCAAADTYLDLTAYLLPYKQTE